MGSQDLEKERILKQSFDEVNSLTKYQEKRAESGLLAASFLILAGAIVFGSTLFLSTRVSLVDFLLFADYMLFFFFSRKLRRSSHSCFHCPNFHE